MSDSCIQITTNNQEFFKCGEVFCQYPQKLSIVCIFCEDLFKFEDFFMHFKNIHCGCEVPESKEVKHTNELGLNIKEEFSTEAEFTQNVLEPVINGAKKVGEKTPFESFWQKNDSSNSTDNMFLEENNGKMNEAMIQNKSGAIVTEVFKCEICKKSYTDRNVLRNHERNVHHIYVKPPEKRAYMCLNCENSFPSIRLHDEHCNEEHNGVSCQHCDKKFMTSGGRDLHFTASHAENVRFMCDVPGCGVTVSSQVCLKRHKITHLPIDEKRKYACTKCGSKFSRQERLILHKQKHEATYNDNKKIYPCEVCGKEFPRSTLRSQHRDSHKPKTHTCEICGASFRRHNTLYHHMEIHSAVKKYKCAMCDAAFAQAQGLTNHKRRQKQLGRCPVSTVAKTVKS